MNTYLTEVAPVHFPTFGVVAKAGTAVAASTVAAAKMVSILSFMLMRLSCEARCLPVWIRPRVRGRRLRVRDERRPKRQLVRLQLEGESSNRRADPNTETDQLRDRRAVSRGCGTPSPMASAELSRRVEKVVGYPPAASRWHGSSSRGRGALAHRQHLLAHLVQ